MPRLTYIISLSILLFLSCGNGREQSQAVSVSISEEAKNYWYSGQAELTSFKLEQARYGEIRQGTAVMIFVTEDFSTSEFTKVAGADKETIPVLKLNFTKNFVTGIYPYSIMTSSFVPFENFDHALKISTSVQEWCGHVYLELIRKKMYHYLVNSYFEGETIKDGEHTITWLEDEIWSQIRLYPESIPTGEQQVIPSFVYTRLLHKEIKAYSCIISKTVTDSNQTVINLAYPDLERTLEITYESEFPRQIIRWEETYPDGFGDTQKMLTSRGERIKTIRSSYWTKNKTVDQSLRKELGLE